MIDSEQVCKGKVKSTEKLEGEKDPEFFNWQAVIIKITYLLYNGKSATY